MNKSMTKLLGFRQLFTDGLPCALCASSKHGGVLNKPLRGTGESVPHGIVSRLERKNIFSVKESGIASDSSVLPHHAFMFLTGSSTPYYISGGSCAIKRLLPAYERTGRAFVFPY